VTKRANPHLEVQWWYRDDLPSEQLRELLAQCRREGMFFCDAWPLARSRITWHSHRDRLEHERIWDEPLQREAWERGYQRLPHWESKRVAQLRGMHGVMAQDEEGVEAFEVVHTYTQPSVA
jgi:hypothetical protein